MNPSNSPPEYRSYAGTPERRSGGLRQLPPALSRLVAAECAAEAPAAGMEPEDLQQAVWLRWLEREHERQQAPATEHVPGSGAGPSARWLRSAVRAEARRARRRAGRETPWPEEGVTVTWGSAPLHRPAELPVLAAEHRRVLDAAVTRLPGRCPALVRALLSRQDLTYPEIARELGMSQGSLGPVRSRCLGCLRTMLAASDCGT
ncbi:sigma-70 family RNA polymerase sigma factor [Streptomyces ovatisporus]|uniref:Sigma-70 family RNA polymerase sigma factor n=1 Tax=Streptomyces ovatisporus TaxID=1128682 RepID=A0ABV9AA10_9ACTN